MAVTTELRQGAIVLRVAGELDMSSAPELTDHVDGIHLGHDVVLVLDLSDVTFLDSSGLSSLVVVRRAVMNVEGQLGLVVGERTLKLLRVTNMDGVFALYDTVDRAVNHLARAG